MGRLSHAYKNDATDDGSARAVSRFPAAAGSGCLGGKVRRRSQAGEGGREADRGRYLGKLVRSVPADGSGRLSSEGFHRILAQPDFHAARRRTGQRRGPARGQIRCSFVPHIADPGCAGARNRPPDRRPHRAQSDRRSQGDLPESGAYRPIDQPGQVSNR